MKYKLSDVCEYVKEKVDVSSLNEETYISTENMLPNKGGITIASALPLSDQTQAFQKEDVLVSNIRPYFKKIWFASYDGGCSNDVLVFRAKEGTYKRYLYSVLSDDAFFKYAMATSKGTKMPRGDKLAIMQYEIPDYSYDVQVKIAGIMQSIEDKIQNNININQNLSQQLHTLFYEFLSSEPMDKTLGDCVATTSGGTPSRKHDEYYDQGHICWIKSKELLGGYIHDTEEHINDLAIAKSSAKLLPSHSVLIAMYGATVGAYAITSKPMTCNQAICALLSNDDYPYTYLFQFALESQQTIVNLAVGSAQQNVSQVLIKQLPIHSNKEAIRKFHEVAFPIHRKIELLEAEILRLSEMRDSLLPKLISGEIDVSAIEL